MDHDAQEVLDFWFGARGSAQYGQARAEWFRKDPDFDALIAQRFGTPIEAALAGGLRDWARTPAGALARIVVLDQFTRNVFRDTPRAFAGDELALDAAQAMVAAGHDAVLPPVQRSFVYLPYEHAESLPMQQHAVRLFSALAAEAPALQDTLEYAMKHRDIVARFGRFPHRNTLLGRRSTPDELAFLQQPGSSF